MSNMVLVFIYFLLGAFVGALLEYFVFSDVLRIIDARLFGEAEVILNITELNPLPEQGNLENFTLTFGTSQNSGRLVAVEKGHPGLNKEFGDTLIPDDFSSKNNYTEYSVTISNVGRRIAQDIEFSFSGKNLRLDYERDVSNAIDFVNCGGFGGTHSCESRIARLKYLQKMALFVRASEPSVQDVECSMRSVGRCHVNYRKFHVRMVAPDEKFEIRMNGASLPPLPDLHKGQTQIIYWYSSKSNSWLLKKEALEVFLRESGYNFDLSSIPPGSTISNYSIGKDGRIVVEHSEEKMRDLSSQ